MSVHPQVHCKQEALIDNSATFKWSFVELCYISLVVLQLQRCCVDHETLKCSFNWDTQLMILDSDFVDFLVNWHIENLWTLFWKINLKPPKKKKETNPEYLWCVCGYFEDLCMIYIRLCSALLPPPHTKKNTDSFFFFFFFSFCMEEGEPRSRHQMQGLVGRSTLHKPKQQRKGARTDGRLEDEAAAGASSSSQPGARSPRRRRRKRSRGRGSKQLRVTAAWEGGRRRDCGGTSSAAPEQHGAAKPSWSWVCPLADILLKLQHTDRQKKKKKKTRKTPPWVPDWAGRAAWTMRISPKSDASFWMAPERATEAAGPAGTFCSPSCWNQTSCRGCCGGPTTARTWGGWRGSRRSRSCSGTAGSSRRPTCSDLWGR